MKSFDYVIKDDVGIHARPAGLLVKQAGNFKSVITVKNNSNGKISEANKLFGIMGLAVKCGDEITVSVTGDDEDMAYDEMKKFFNENL